MNNSIKNKLKKIKTTLEKQNNIKIDLENKKEIISKKLENLTEEQSKLIEYNNYRNNSHIAVAAITLIGSFFITKNVLDQEIIYSILISLGIASTSSLGTHRFFKNKINKLKKSNPEIDFENGNVDINQKKIQNLLQKQMENSKKITDINEMTKKCSYCYEELIKNENTNSLDTCEILNEKSLCDKEIKEKAKEKILVMTIE